MMVSIDPGLSYCGVACWNDGVLQWARLVSGASAEARLPLAKRWAVMRKAISVVWDRERRAAEREAGYVYVDRLVLELPQVYTREKSKGDPNDLIALAGLVGRLADREDVAIYLPREWKGQAPKEVTAARAEKKLTPAERANVFLPAKSLAHNVWDAVALGLYDLKQRGIRR